jgi:hypothetical protein
VNGSNLAPQLPPRTIKRSIVQSDGVQCYRAALLGVAYSCERGGSDYTPTARGKEQDAMARTVLVSFLGKGIRATEEQPRSHLGYRTARYDFTHLGGSV